MALTTYVKSRSVDVSTGIETVVYYEQAEWDTLQAELAAAELPNAKAVRIEEIKREAYDRIVTILPEYKQRNGLARALELQNEARTRALTTEEEAELADFKTLWSQLKAVRADSDAAEAAVLAATTVAEVEAVVF